MSYLFFMLKFRGCATPCNPPLVKTYVIDNQAVM